MDTVDADFAVDEAALRNFMPTSFGKQSRVANVEAQIDQSRRKVEDNKPKKVENGTGDANGLDGGSEDRRKEKKGETDEDKIHEDEYDDDDDDDDYDEDEDEFPTTHELILKTHDRTVTSITLDPSGARLITGSTDCTLKLHDFASMTPTTVRAFKSVDPTASKYSTNVETHPVHHVAFNPLAPSLVLVVTALPQAKIISRDGEPVAECVKGDMYLRDMHNTKGHVSEVTTGTWHPTDKNRFVTAGTDSTLRIWDVNNTRQQKEVIVLKSRAAGSSGRTRATAVAWGAGSSAARYGGGGGGGGGPMDKVLVTAALDGTLVMWPADGPYARPAAEIRDAHAPGTWTGGLDISADGRLVVTRGGDDTVKLWDTRKFKTAISSVQHVSTSAQYPASNICFSPTGTNVITGSQTGHLHILNPATLKPELVTPVTPGHPLVAVCWHEKLNQIITGSANAETHVLYNPELSTGGAKMVMTKAPKRRHIDDDPNLTMDLSQGMSGDSIITPGAGGRLPSSTGTSLSSIVSKSKHSSSAVAGGGGGGGVGGGDTNHSSAAFSARHPTIGLTASGKSRDPRRPHLPAVTPFAKSQPDEKHIRESIPLSSMRYEDPREALLKYADKAKKDPLFTRAWSKTQPEAVYGDVSDEEDGEAGKKSAGGEGDEDEEDVEGEPGSKRVKR